MKASSHVIIIVLLVLLLLFASGWYSPDFSGNMNKQAQKNSGLQSSQSGSLGNLSGSFSDRGEIEIGAAFFLKQTKNLSLDKWGG